MIRSYLKKSFLQAHEERHENPETFHVQTAIVLVLSAVCLMLIRYTGSWHSIVTLTDMLGMRTCSLALIRVPSAFGNPALFELIYWACICILFYFVVPLVYILFFSKQALSSFGLSNLFSIKSGYKIYLLFLATMLPLVYLVSTQEAFLSKYPFYMPRVGEGLWPNFFLWQFFYFLQFVSLEFFFRGFMLHGIKRTLGFYSIFVMMLPYCMIHFQKPFLETTGAIVAGIALGIISLRNNSIATGIALHYTVALSMDLLALYHKGYL